MRFPGVWWLALLPSCSHVACLRPPDSPPSLRAERTGRRCGIGTAKGDANGTAHAYYGVPIRQKSLAWDGNGETDDYGAVLRAYRFVDDGIALGLGLAGSVFLTEGHDAYAVEGEVLLRWYFLQCDDWRAFWDASGGWLQSTRGVPDGGTQWNMTFGFGPGVDIPVAGGTSFLLGGTYHHISNALGRDNDRNPSQNEGRFWFGLGFTF